MMPDMRGGKKDPLFAELAAVKADLARVRVELAALVELRGGARIPAAHAVDADRNPPIPDAPQAE